MKISVVTLCYNEEKMLPFFLNHYSEFCDEITIYDNQSTDSSLDIITRFKKCKVNVITFKTDNSLNDQVHQTIKNTAWKECKGDYVIVCDMDELLYHPNLKEYLARTNQPFYRPQGYDMITEIFPDRNIPIIDQVKEGAPADSYCKSVLFSTKEIDRVHFECGAHYCTFYSKDGNPLKLEEIDPELKLLHYKNLTFDYRYNRNSMLRDRLSDYNQRTNAGIHYTFEKERQLGEFNRILEHKQQVI